MGRSTSESTWESDIEYCKKIHPQLAEAKIDWQGFAG
jgi:hypothetical protein